MAAKRQAKGVEYQGGPFLTGLSVGLFAGALGYYLFSTKKGGELRETLQEEWEAARQVLYEQGIIPSAEMTLKDVMSHSLTELATWFEQSAEHTAQGKKKVAPTQPEKFKGV